MSARYISLSGADHARLTEAEQTDLTHWVGNRAYMRTAEGRCSALLCENSGFPCSIYERRPSTCRTLERGSDACLNDRERVLNGDGSCAQKRIDLLR
jgi:Fe-S-cluster containining protein